MPTPPTELLWITAASGIVSIIVAAFNIFIMFRNRRRIVFRPISAEIYYETWWEHDVEANRLSQPSPLARGKAAISTKDCKQAFIVVEFSIRNEYPTDLTVGRFMIDGWIFSDKYVPPMYPWLRDYRVFALHTRQRINLESFVRIPPKGSYALRIEVLETAHGPRYGSSKSRYAVKLPKSYDMTFYTDQRAIHKEIKFKRPKIPGMPLYRLYHWSDLLEDSDPTSSSIGSPLPQGLSYPKWKPPVKYRIHSLIDRWLIYRIRNPLLYGTKYPQPGQSSRLTIFMNTIILRVLKRNDRLRTKFLSIIRRQRKI